MQRIYWLFGATDSDIPGKWPVLSFLRKRTIGRLLDTRRPLSASETVQNCSAASTEGTITAKGLLLFLLFARSLLTASSFIASQAIWNPPSPLIAMMPPCFSDVMVF